MKIVLFANTDWYLYNFRLSLARRLRAEGHEVLLLSPEGPYASRFEALGLRWRPLKMRRRSINPLVEAGVVLQVMAILRKERPDLLHGFTLKAAIYGALAARMVGGIARVNAVAGTGFVFTSQRPLARFLKPLVRGLLRLALGGERAMLIVQNREDLELFLRHRLVSPGQARLIASSGVDCRRFQPARRGRGEPAPLRVLMAARLLWEKGLRELLQASDLLRAQGRRIEFLLAGAPDDGNPSSASADDVREWEAQGRVNWLGHVEDMPTLLASVDIVTLPTRYGEGVPRFLIEAAASALPIITTDHPGCRDVVSHEVEGLLVPVGDGAALATAIARLADDVDLARRLGQAARRKAVEFFDEEIVIGQTLAVYRELGAHPNSTDRYGVQQMA